MNTTPSPAREAVEQIKKALDAGPTDGPWHVYEAEGDATAHGISAKEGEAVSWWSEAREEGVTKLEDARFIAACNPENIRAVLALLAAKQEEVDRMREALKGCMALMGPKTPPCCQGCEYEWTEALKLIRAALSPIQGAAHE